MNYLWHLLTLIVFYSILAASLNMVMGYGGMLSLCHAVFCGIGAYSTALLTTRYGWEFLPSIAAGVALAALVGGSIAFLAARASAEDFVLTTLALQVIFVALLQNLSAYSGGPYGIPGVPVPNIFGVSVGSPMRCFLLALGMACICLPVLWIMTHSPYGRVLKAMREDELALGSLGRRVPSFKIGAFAMSAGIAAMPGSLYAGYIRYVDPSSFDLPESVLILSMVTLGGAGSFVGPLLGAGILVVLPESLRLLSMPEPVAAATRQVLYGVLLILVMRIRPRGLRGEYGFERPA